MDKIFSTDSHVVEPPDLWTERLPRALIDRAPKLVSEESGDWWYVDGLRATSVSAGIDAGVRHEGAEKLRLAGRFEEVRKGAYLPAEKLADMDLDGIDNEIVYTTLGLRLWRLPDTALLSAVHRAYNDWIAEFCQTKPDRLQGIALVLLDDVDEGIKELERAAGLGLVGAMISVYPAEDRSYDLPIYEPFWAAAQDLDMPLSLHIGTNRALPPTSSTTRDMSWSDIKLLSTPALYSTFPYWVQMSIANMIFSGVFERFPSLKVVSLEHEGGWAAFFMQAMDYTYTQRARRPQWPRFKTEAVPSEFFRRNVSLSLQEDALAIQLRSVIGVDSLVWGSDYPHHETTFPKSREALERLLDGASDGDREKILVGNAERLYRGG